jgi:hypothetical protein
MQCAAACAVLVMIVVLLSRFMLSDDRLHPEAARPIIRIEPAGDSQHNPKVRVHWLDAHRLIIINGDYVDKNLSNNWRGRADLIDISTRVRSRFACLDNFLNRPNHRMSNPPSEFELSPNGAWLMFQDHQAGERLEGDTSVLHLTSGHFRTWRYEINSVNVWADDAHVATVTCSELEPASAMIIHDLNSAQLDLKVAPSSSRARSILKNYDYSHPLMKDLSFTDDSNGFVSRLHCDESDGLLRVSSGNLFIPSNMHVADVPYAPHVSNTVLHGFRTDAQPFAVALSRLVPILKAHPVVTELLWIKRPQSGEMQELAHISGRLDAAGALDAKIEQVQVSPDGAQISFICRGQLYIMPVGR